MPEHPGIPVPDHGRLDGIGGVLGQRHLVPGNDRAIAGPEGQEDLAVAGPLVVPDDVVADVPFRMAQPDRARQHGRGRDRVGRGIVHAVVPGQDGSEAADLPINLGCALAVVQEGYFDAGMADQYVGLLGVGQTAVEADVVR